MRFAHTNIAAKNWRSLTEFYIKVFHCKIKPPERNLSGTWLDQATGLQAAILEGVHLLLPGHGENGPTLEIFITVPGRSRGRTKSSNCKDSKYCKNTRV